MRGTAAPLQRGPFSLTIPDTVGPLTIPGGASGSALSDDLLPWLINIDVFMTLIDFSGVGGAVADSNRVYNGHRQMGTLGAWMEFDVVLAAGTWTVEAIHRQFTADGIVTFSLDGSSIGTMDFYAASLVNNKRTQITGAAVVSTGKKRLRLEVTGKNPASTNYSAYPTHIQFKRTA